MPRKSVLYNMTVEIPKGCYVDKTRLYVYYRKNSIRRSYKDRPGTYPDHERICVGKALPKNSTEDEFRLMVPNVNFPAVLVTILKASGLTDAEAILEVKSRFGNSINISSTQEVTSGNPLIILRQRDENNYLDHVSIGIQVSFNVLARDSGLMTDLVSAFGEEDAFMLLDLAQYMISAKSAVFQHFPHWAKTHMLFFHYIPSDTTISAFFSEINQARINLFRKLWARRSINDGKLSLSYDSTNVGSQADGVALVEKGHAKEDPSLEQINTEYVIRHEDGTPVTYSEYPGSINDIKEAKKMIGFLGGIVEDVNKEPEEKDLTHLDVDIIFDRGYISEPDVREMDSAGIGFLLMLRRSMGIAEDIIKENIDNVRCPENYVQEHDIYTYTITGKLFSDDQRVRYFHIIWDAILEISHRKRMYSEIESFEKQLNKMVECKHNVTEDDLKKYKRYFKFTLESSGSITVKKKGEGIGNKSVDVFTIISFARDDDSIKLRDRMCGHYVLVTSGQMTGVQAYEKYKKQEGVEKVFSVMKSRLGMDKYGVHSDDAVCGKSLVWFLASIMYALIKIKTTSLRLKSKKSFTTTCVLDYLEEYEADIDLETCRYAMRYSATHKQELVFNALGIKSGDFEAAIRKIEYTRAKNNA